MKPHVAPIVGGDEAKPNDWPWAAALYLKKNGKKKFHCGGSIVNEHYILTAAHCLMEKEKEVVSPKDLLVKVGANDLASKQGATLRVSKAIPHEKYVHNGAYDDVALLKLSDNVDFTNPNVRPICLPTQEMLKENFTGEEVTVIGWGLISYVAGDTEKKLREVDVTVISTPKCDKDYQKEKDLMKNYPKGITDQFICAGSPEGGKDSCQGDSGGPLMYEKKGIFYQLGIVSFGYKCGKKTFPGVYTNLPFYVDWINKNMMTRKKS